MNEKMTKDIETIRAEHSKSFSVADMVNLYVSHWYWFFIALFLTLSYGVYTIITTPPTYTRSLDLLIKTEERNGAMKDFQRLGIGAGTNNLTNEMYTLRTTQLMEEVVRRLNLDLQVAVKQRLRYLPLYETSPVDIYFSSINEHVSFAFGLKIKNKNEAEICGLGDNAKVYKVKLNKWSKSPYGNIMIKTNERYNASWNKRELFVTKYSLKSLARMYSNRLSVDDKVNTSILYLSLSDENPQRADDILLTLVRVYNENWLYNKNLTVEATSRFIEERLNSLTKELNDVDSSVANFKSSNLVGGGEDFSSRYVGRAENSYNKIFGLNNNLSMAKYLKDYLMQNSSSDKFELLPVNAVGSGNVSELINNYNELVLKRKEVLKNTNINAPIVKEYSEKVIEMRKIILSSLNNEISQIEKQIQGYKSEEKRSNTMIALSPHKESKLSGIARRQKVLQSLYVFLLQKREETELSKSFTATNSQVIEAPYGNSNPTSPDKKNILMNMLLIGLAVPAILLFFFDYMNNSLRGRADLKGYSIPFLGELPSGNKKRRFRKSTPQSRFIIVKPNKRDRMNEAFRILRTKLSFFLKTGTHQGSKAKTVMLTSFNPASGKTFIASNMGVAMALSKKRVLLIDMDIRRSSLTKMMDERPSIGLTNYLSSDEHSIDEIICHDAFTEGLDLIPSGVKAPNPTELLSSVKMQGLFEELRERYDYIFMDCPPLEIVADASIIKNYADVTIFVARVGLMDRRSLPELEYMYQHNKFNQLCILLNDVNFVNSRYGRYRYGYGYSYGYSYGYGRYGNYYDK